MKKPSTGNRSVERGQRQLRPPQPNEHGSRRVGLKSPKNVPRRLKPEIDSDHGLRGLREFVGGGEEAGEIGRFVEVAAILSAQADVGQQTPVETCAVHKDGLAGGTGGSGNRNAYRTLRGALTQVSLPTGRYIEDHAGAGQREGAKIGKFDRGNPIAGDLVGIRFECSVQAAAKDVIRWARRIARAVGLVGAIVGVCTFITEPGLADVAQLNQPTGGIGWALLNSVCAAGSGESSIKTCRNIRLRKAGRAAQGKNCCQ